MKNEKLLIEAHDFDVLFNARFLLARVLAGNFDVARRRSIHESMLLLPKRRGEPRGIIVDVRFVLRDALQFRAEIIQHRFRVGQRHASKEFALFTEQLIEILFDGIAKLSAYGRGSRFDGTTIDPVAEDAIL